MRPFGVKSLAAPQYMVLVHCLIVPWTDAHGTFYDTNPSQMTPEAWMICHHPVYHGNDNSVAVKAPKPWHKRTHWLNRVSMSFHITTITATLPTYQQPYPRQREKIRRTNTCMPFFVIFHSITRPLNMTGSTSCEFHTHCSSATNRLPWFHLPTSESFEQPYKSAEPLKNSCYRSR
jgi:hypothetical protein